MERSDLDNYFFRLEEEIKKEYSIANLARKMGKDPVDKTEVLIASTMAEKCVSLVSTVYPKIPIKKISDRIIELENKHGQLDLAVSFIIAKEVAENKFCKFNDKLESIDAGIRIGFSYLTLGVVASPIEGYTGLEVGKRKDGKEYLIANFSGPIRSAGTTASCLIIVLIDYLRFLFGFEKYDPTKEEVERYLTENTDYHERVTNLQYFPTEEEMRFLAGNLPIQISGDPTERKEVSNYKDLRRVNTNYIRGGMCLIFSEGLAQKATKAIGRLRGSEKWFDKSLIKWLEDYSEIHSNTKTSLGEDSAIYIKDLVAGRPVYGHPGASGGFRLRYGRSRTSGFSAVSIHPATMGVTNDFLSNGTQLRLEKPIKGCIITSCDSIGGPIVKLKNGTVVRIETYEEGKGLYQEIEEIIYLGDMLISLGDFKDRNSYLYNPGYVEEWWSLEAGIKGEDISFENAVKISKEKGVALFPKYTFYWNQVSIEQFSNLVSWLKKSKWRSGKIVLQWDNVSKSDFSKGKRCLELLGVSHKVHIDNVVIDKESRAFLFNLGVFDLYNDKNIEIDFDKKEKDVLKIINKLCPVKIKDKAGTFIGSRMGRPEKAKLRHLTGSPNVLFPIGDSGGRLRNIHDSVKSVFTKQDVSNFICECGNETIFPYCEKCGKKTTKVFYCGKCNASGENPCKLHGGQSHHNTRFNISEIFSNSVKSLGYEMHEVPPLIKGIKKLSSENKIPENLSKGILRSKYNLSVNKDGTIRYDGTEIPITHFSPKEIGINVEKIIELGYTKDINGDGLKSEDQILEIMPHDIIIPKGSLSEDGINPILRIGNFLDEELEKLYCLPRHYNLESEMDLAGKSVVCIAPHNCAGVMGRIIGFSNMQGILASPYMHAAIRRDCDGDEMAIMLMLDVLINFSREFLPGHRGGTQDAPLVINSRIRANEVDDQILSLDVGGEYPPDLYHKAELGMHSSEVRIDDIGSRLKASSNDPFFKTRFTHSTKNINEGASNGSYKILPTMKEKVASQMELVKKIRAVDENDVARLVLERHFIRDIRGNLRKFSRQQFRCSSCNEKYRRVPLSGVCYKCGGKIIFTISEGSVKKYLESAIDLAKNYNISDYTKEEIELTIEYIETMFGKFEEDSSLSDFS